MENIGHDAHLAVEIDREDRRRAADEEYQRHFDDICQECWLDKKICACNGWCSDCEQSMNTCGCGA